MVLFAGCVAAPRPTVPAGELAKVWRIDRQDGWGTGFPVSCTPAAGGFEVVFLTAAHVVYKEDGYSVRHQDGRMLRPGKILRRHPSEDAALVVFPSPDYVEPMSLCFDDPRPGERLYAAGAQGYQSFTQVTMWLTTALASSARRSGLAMYSGGSGSPVMRKTGEVCAMVIQIGEGRNAWTGVPELIYHHSYSIPMSALRDFL
jgi:S1-C subfamily serine protease